MSKKYTKIIPKFQNFYEIAYNLNSRNTMRTHDINIFVKLLLQNKVCDIVTWEVFLTTKKMIFFSGSFDKCFKNEMFSMMNHESITQKLQEKILHLNLVMT